MNEDKRISMNLAKIKLEQTKHLIEVLEAYVAGKAVQVDASGTHVREWVDVNDTVQFSMNPTRYRIKPLTPDRIDWSHVNPYYKFMARDATGATYLYGCRPRMSAITWCADDPCVDEVIRADNFASFAVGERPWNESLVERPA